MSFLPITQNWKISPFIYFKYKPKLLWLVLFHTLPRSTLPLGVMSLYLLLYSFLGHQLFLLPLNLLSLSSCPLSIPRWTVLRQGIDLEKMLSVHSDPLNTEDWGWGGSTCTNSCKTKLNRKISRFFWWSPQFITFDYTYCCLGFNNQPTTDCLK